MNTVIVYTDGACSGNPGPGGFAAIVIAQGKEHIIKGGDKNTTNNRMEMIALIEALQYVQSNHKDERIEIHVDSQYVLKGATEWLPGWKRKNWKATSGPVKNRELWEQIDSLMQGLTLKWIWVKGHDGEKYNEMADEIAVSEVENHRK